MSTGDDSNSQQLAQAFVQGFVTENYINFAILAVLLHDTGAYFEEEVKYFWSKPKSAISVLYFVSRYGSILGIASDISCVSGLAFSSTNHLKDITGRMLYVQLILHILFLRVRALYSQGRMITRVLLAIFGLEVLALIGIVMHGTILEHPSVDEVFVGLSVCAIYVPSFAEVVSSWCIPLAYSTLLMVIALYKARQFWKESAGFKNFNLIKILIRDQVFYFLAVNIVCIAEILSNTVELNSSGQYVLAGVGNPILVSLVGSRLLFNMREAGEKGLNQGISCSLKSVTSNIDFAVPPGSVAGSSLGDPTESMEAEILNDV